MRLKRTWLTEGLKLEKMSPILLGVLLISAIIFLPGLSYDRLKLAQADRSFWFSQMTRYLGWLPRLRAFISSDSNTCALDDPSTFLHIECIHSLPILFPSLSQISTTKKSVSLQNNDTLLADAENFTQDSEIFDPNLLNTNETP